MSLSKKLFIGSSAAGACPTDSVQPFGVDSAYSSNIALYQLNSDGGTTNNVPDTVGNYNGTASNVTYSTGQFGNAAVFNGSSSYIESGISTNILNSDYTISFWGKSSNGSGGQTFINTNNNAVAFVRIDYSAGGNLSFYHRASSGANDGDSFIVSGMADGNWHHVVITKDNTSVKAYKDGSLVGTITSTSGTYSNNTTLQIGRNNYNANGANNLDGNIDQVRIYDKALSSDEVEILYNETTDTVSDTNVLGEGSGVALYSLDYDASDASGNYDGTANSNVTFGVDGQINYGADFTGGGVVAIPNNAIYGNNHSISAWFKLDNTSGYQGIFDFDYNNRIMFRVASSDANEALVGTSGWFAHNINFSANQWYHLVITFSNGNPFKIYVDGSVAYTGGNSSLNAQLGDNNFGAGNAAGVHSINGNIDQLRIFSKELSASEVSTLYAETACVYTSTTDTLNYQGTNLAYYKLDNNANDETTNYDGAESNITYEFGRFGTAAVFNGSSSEINIGGSPFNSLTSITISSWINSDANSNYSIIANVGKLSTDGKSLSMARSRSTVNGSLSPRELYVSTGSSTFDGNYIFETDTWYNVVATYSGTSLKIYVNGDLTASHTVASMSFDSSGNGGYLGRGLNPTYPFHWNGKIDQVRIFDSALDAAAIENLYNEKQAYITKDASDPFADNSEKAFYKLENNANDSTGSYNGTWSGTPAYITGVFGQGADFNGTNRIDTGITSNYSSYTISVWAKKDAGGEKYIIQKGDYVSSSNNNFTLIGHNASGTLYVYNRLNGTINQNVSGITLNTGEWFHLVVTKDSSNINTIYYNGVKQTTSSFAPANSSSNEWQIGGGDLGGFWDGGIDQVRIFDRALDGDEVFKLYAEVIN